MQKAQIENGVVVNLIMVDSNAVPDWCADWPVASDEVGIGWSYADGVFTSPPEPPPAPAPVPASISFAQLLIGLVAEQWITEAEGEGWLTGTLPAAVTAVINALPVEQRFAAKARALRPSEVLRADPLVAAMGVAAGKTEAEIDAFFQTYAGV